MRAEAAGWAAAAPIMHTQADKMCVRRYLPEKKICNIYIRGNTAATTVPNRSNKKAKLWTTPFGYNSVSLSIQELSTTDLLGCLVSVANAAGVPATLKRPHRALILYMGIRGRVQMWLHCRGRAVMVIGCMRVQEWPATTAA